MSKGQSLQDPFLNALRRERIHRVGQGGQLMLHRGLRWSYRYAECEDGILTG